MHLCFTVDDPVSLCLTVQYFWQTSLIGIYGFSEKTWEWKNLVGIGGFWKPLCGVFFKTTSCGFRSLELNNLITWLNQSQLSSPPLQLYLCLYLYLNLYLYFDWYSSQQLNHLIIFVTPPKPIKLHSSLVLFIIINCSAVEFVLLIQCIVRCVWVQWIFLWMKFILKSSASNLQRIS